MSAPEKRRRFSMTRLGNAATAGDFGAVRAELENDYYRTKGRNWDTMLGRALIHACEAGQATIAAYLIDRGARTNYLNNRAIAIAAGKGQIEAMALLVERGASVNHCQSLFFSPLAQAAEHCQWEAVRWLLDQGAKTGLAQALYWCAIHAEGAEVAQLLLDAGAPLSTSYGSALDYAVENGNEPVARLLWKRGVRPQTGDISDSGLHLLATLAEEEPDP
jgi:hypothetical protein